MTDGSSIEWTDATWNPIRARNYDAASRGELFGWHCEKVSSGCANCYAERINLRLGTKHDYGRNRYRDPLVFLDEKTLSTPLRWRKPRKVFVCSMTDLFGEWVPDEWIDRVFAVMAMAPQHTFQILTKRAMRMREYLTRGMERRVRIAAHAFNGGENGPPVATTLSTILSDELWPLPNVWLGISAEDQQRLDERVPELLRTPAALRWVSAEPLLGPLRMSLVCGRCGGTGEIACSSTHYEACPGHAIGIDWVIVGGESGPGSRPMDVAWALDIVRQCREAVTPCFVKQLGAKPYQENGRAIDGGRALLLRDRKGGDPAEWPGDLRVREYPQTRGGAK